MSNDKGTPSAEQQATQPSGSNEQNTPPKEQTGGEPQPPQEGKNASTQSTDTILGELKKISGRLTKVEQRAASVSKQTVSSEKKGFTFEPPEPQQGPDPEILDIQQRQEVLALERSITPLLRDKKYENLLETDETLAEILSDNPLALLKEDPIDAQDAYSQIVEMLDKKVENLSQKAKAKEEKEAQPAPQAGPANTTETGSTPQQPSQAGQQKLKSSDEVSAGLAEKIGSNPRLGVGIRK